MCGIAGYVTWQGLKPSAPFDLQRMTDAILHRGPETEGAWMDDMTGIAFGHRRLAIVDLSPAGHQPMLSPSDRFVLAFNGEIYNHEDIRREVERRGPCDWRGHSDTETLLAGFEAFGIEETIRQARGMFAMAIWDQKERTLTLARDRLGEKPLYYGWQGKDFLFGSELKAIRAHPSFSASIQRDALCLYFRHNCIGGSASIYQDIHKVEPGQILTLSHGKREPLLKTYWSGADVARRGVTEPFQGSPDEAVDALEVLLKDAIKSQMMADVPLGAFLSGGIDSSTIVALMQAQSSRPVKTFSIGFTHPSYDEAPYAKAVAEHLGTDHTELYVTPDQAMKVIPGLHRMYDEPFADSSQIPTFLVAKLARQHVTVSLSGDAGDELFCGYNRYQINWDFWGKIPYVLRHGAAKFLTAVPPRVWDSLPLGQRAARLGDKIHKAALVMDQTSAEDVYTALTSHWRDPASLVIGGAERARHAPDLQGLSDVERRMARDMLGYLPDDILVKLDRAAMAVSLEGRVPFLDPRVVEFAWSLPLSYKFRDGKTKWPLRQVLYRHVPRHLIERPKTGFGIPLDAWLRGPLKSWAEDLLDETRLKREGYLNPAPVRAMWADHLSGKRNGAYHLWDVLMFEAWLQENGA